MAKIDLSVSPTNMGRICTITVTPLLRWLKPEPDPRGIQTTGPAKLQQAWKCLETGEIEWKDVPTEIGK
jgi:hypothetical protein